MVIYEVKCLINKKGYIGQTIQCLPNRWASHVRDALSFKSNTLFHRAIRKYGPENFIVKAIETCNSIEELNKQETNWITKKDYTNNKKGYNLTSGGKNFKFNKEVKEKISKSLTGMKFKRHISKEKASKIAKKNGLKTFKNNESYNKWLLANGSGEFNVYEAICIQTAKRNQKAIYKKGKFVGSWLSAVQFNIDMFGKKTRGQISNCLSGKRNQYKGYIFEKEDKYPETRKICKDIMLNINKKQFKVYKNKKLIGFWENQSTCADELKINASNIGHCLKGNRKSHKNYTFEYTNFNYKGDK
jgi:group I intron endonuclease